MVYVKLKEFRAKHNLHQKDLAAVLGCTQSFVSRMEKNYYELEESQYQRLVDKFGEDEVSCFRGDKPIQNAISPIRRVRRINPNNCSTPTEVKKLAEVVRLQQEEITRLHRRIDELTNLLLKK